MVSKNQIKSVQKLKIKKYRHQFHLFIAEGDKIVQEFLKSPTINVQNLYATSEWLSENNELHSKYQDLISEVNDKELKLLSALNAPNKVLITAEIPEHTADTHYTENDLSLVMDNIRDPGNLGTVIRIADWFGIQQVFCLENCVDVYNPKVVQATMGSLARVKVINSLAKDLFSQFSQVPVYAAEMDGVNIYRAQTEHRGFIIIGNESFGISPDLRAFISHSVSIPRYGEAESLNAAIACGIICSVFRS